MTEQTIFLSALDIPDAAKRTAHVERACAGDAALRRQVEALLAAHEKSGLFLDEPAVEQMAAGANTLTTDPSAPAGPDTATLTSPGSSPRANDDLAFLKPPPRPGSLGRLDRYEVLEVLGRGGFGTVLRAFDERLHRVVAIKVLAPQLATSGTARARFNREAKATAAVRDEHVVGIHEVSESDAPIPYLVMEYIAGQTLQQKLDRTGPLSVPEILRIGSQIAKGLAAAHATGHIHRDVKPSNILLENGVERVKITDFGLARTADDASISHSGLVAGTPHYMAPEQAHGGRIDQRADLFGLGSVLYAMCTGHPPFRATTTMAVLKRVCEEDPRPIQEINPEVPVWLEKIVAKLHAKRPPDRFQSANEVAELLEQYLAHSHEPESVPRPERGRTPPRRTEAKASSPRPRRKRRWMAGVAVLLLAGLLVAKFGPHSIRDSFALWSGKALLTIDEEEWHLAQDVEVHVKEHDRVVAVLNSRSNRRVYLEPGTYTLTCPNDDPRSMKAVDVVPAEIQLRSGTRQNAVVRAVPTGMLQLELPPETVVTFEPRPRSKVSDPESDLLHGRATFLFLEGDYRLTAKHANGATLTQTFSIRAERRNDGFGSRTIEMDLRAAFADELAEKNGIAKANTLQSGQPWVSLFNGRDLTGWKAVPDHPGAWSVQGGVLRGGGPGGLLVSDRAYGDFHLLCVARISAGGVGGILFRGDKARLDQNRSDGYKAHINASLENVLPTGSLVDTFAYAHNGWLPMVTPGEWFTCQIIARGNRIQLVVNDLTTLDWTDGNRQRERGHLALQLANDQTVIELKSIEIKELAAAPQLVQLRAFTPGKDALPLPHRGPASAVTVAGDAWRIENTEKPFDAGNFNVMVAQDLRHLPKDGVLVFRAKVKVEGKVRDRTLAWGDLGFGGANETSRSWNQWPSARARYDGNDSEWTEKEVRYPAAEAHKKGPAVYLYAGLHANGVLWLKDVELLHIPPANQ